MVNTRIITSEFEYYEPKTVKEAIDVIVEFGKEAKILAGGSNLIVNMKTGKIDPKYLIYVGKIQELDYIKKEGEEVKVGALATFHDMIKSQELKEFPILSEALKSVSIEVQCMGTIGGNLCNAAPTASSIPPLLVLGARVKVDSLDGSRTMHLEELFSGKRQTVLSPGELLTEVQIPVVPDGNGAAYGELKRKIRVAAMLGRQGDVCKSCKIALGGALDVPRRARKAEIVLEGNKFNDVVDKVCSSAAEEIDPKKWYVREVAKDVVKKVLERAWEGAKG